MKPKGWRNNPHGHRLAAKGISVKETVRETKILLSDIDAIATRMNRLIGLEVTILDDSRDPTRGITATIDGVHNYYEGTFDLTTEYGEMVDGIPIGDLVFKDEEI